MTMNHNVLIITGGEIALHRYAEASAILSEALTRAGMTVTATRDAAAARSLGNFAAVVLFTDGDFFDSAGLDSLINFVQSGRGLVSIHTAAGTNKSHAGFGKLIGSRIASGAIMEHQANVVDANHPITHRMHDFRLDDEVHALEPLGEYRVLVDAWLNGRREPLLYVKPHGGGQVVHFATGHSLAGISHPQWQRLFVRAVRFVCGEDWQTKSIKCACIGYGGAYNMGKTHLLSCRKNLMTPVAVCDVDPKRTETAKAELGDDIQTYNNVNAMLEKSDAEMVIVITPHNTHAPLSLQVLNSGRHVVTEKPYTITVDEATSLIDTARKVNKMATVFHNRRWDGDFMAIQKVINSGLIGDVFHIECAFGNYGEPKADWWRASKDISGGAFYDWGAHFVDWILQLIPHKIESISGDFKKLKWQGVTNEDYTSAYVRFAGQRSAFIEQGAINAIDKARWRILGTLGGIEKAGWDWESKETLKVVSHASGSRVETRVPYLKSDWDGFYRNIADHLILGEPLAVTPESARKVIAVLSLAEQSSRQGGTPIKPNFEQ
ncbi:MAG: ThuA domain-containing protein [Burkholderiales bacterium]|nr:ThuA domain-containing protein [Phycisphaerae bacterium]